MSLLGETRYFAAEFVHGMASNFEQRDAYIAGTLPFRGVDRVALVGAKRADGDDAQLASLDGGAFYFDSRPVGTFRLKVYVGRFDKPRYTVPFQTYDPQHPGMPFAAIKDLKLADLSLTPP